MISWSIPLLCRHTQTLSDCFPSLIGRVQWMNAHTETKDSKLETAWRSLCQFWHLKTKKRKRLRYRLSKSTMGVNWVCTKVTERSIIVSRATSFKDIFDVIGHYHLFIRREHLYRWSRKLTIDDNELWKLIICTALSPLFILLPVILSFSAGHRRQSAGLNVAGISWHLHSLRLLLCLLLLLPSSGVPFLLSLCVDDLSPMLYCWVTKGELILSTNRRLARDKLIHFDKYDLSEKDERIEISKA